MPTAYRLVAACCLAVLAFIVSSQVINLSPEGTNFGYFTYVNIGLGVICGWVVMGKRTGRGITAAINNGLTGMVALVFWGLFVQGTNEMFKLAMRHRYDGPFEAVLGIFQLGVEYGKVLLEPHIIWTLLIGGVVSGLLTELAWRRWR
ncbi:tellurium resistance protein [Ruegeria marisrubri]|uniref:Tellurium resistance protein n=1 Tax=Ruegeria marisrubri TaxID=1685379 RepID=A0A0X3TYR3_9RHOB|nr:TrgA family protein [Ruegeria marisrubri]KUJ80893.1 tellurium resistance protein [Ruegeria marisrubri]